MAPRLRPCSLAAALPCCPSTIPQSTSLPTHTSRAFSQTCYRQVTARRRRFYEWLNGPGAQVKRPLPKSTNYLGAYDSYGNLIRAEPGYQRGREEPEKKTEDAAEEAVNSKGEETPQGQEQVDELELAVRRDEEKSKDNLDDANKLPPETIEDLRPFPLNKYFRSQPVLSEDLREAIYHRVTRDGATVPLASVEFGVSNERVGAVVRLKQLEKEWVAQGKKLALPYARAVLDMLPTTPYIDPSKPENKGKRPINHEPINDLIVHPATRQQLFVPVAESRQFTRVDAGKAFQNDLLPADERIPHPELVLAERDRAAGLSMQERQRLAVERFEAEQAKKAEKEAAKQAELRNLMKIPKRRWDFVVQDISVEKAGKDGRGPNGVGWRYGFPYEDRKKGQVKIPTFVEA